MRYRALLSAASSPTVGTPRDRILAVIDAFEDEVLSDACRGCPFLMVLAEFPDPQRAVHVNAVAHKAWLRELFLGLVNELALSTGLSDSEPLADRLMLVSEGIYGSAQSLGPTGPAKLGRVIAELLLDASSEVPPSGSTIPEVDLAQHDEAPLDVGEARGQPNGRSRSGGDRLSQGHASSYDAIRYESQSPIRCHSQGWPHPHFARMPACRA
jgi:hypothetical protein